jgi:hypothetical protein
MWGFGRERNARQFEDVETLVLVLRRNVLNTLYLWISAHHSPSCVTFAEFLNYALLFPHFRGSLVYFLCTRVVSLCAFSIICHYS